MTERVASLTEGGGKPAGFDGRSSSRPGAFCIQQTDVLAQKWLETIGSLYIDAGGGCCKIYIGPPGIWDAEKACNSFYDGET